MFRVIGRSKKIQQETGGDQTRVPRMSVCASAFMTNGWLLQVKGFFGFVYRRFQVSCFLSFPNGDQHGPYFMFQVLYLESVTSGFSGFVFLVFPNGYQVGLFFMFQV
jgi:hypothetical protein